MSKHLVTVILTVEVTLDDSKFTPEFCDQFNNSISYFGEPDNLDEHAKHLAWVHSTGLQDLSTYPGKKTFEFVEGYGPVNEMGISARLTDTEVEYEGLTS